MSDLLLHIPTKIFFGPDVVNRIGQTVAELGTRALLVTESAHHQGKLVERVEELLTRKGVHTILFDHVDPGGSNATIDELISLVRVSQARVVIGLGGMKVLSAARCAAVAAAADVSIYRILDGQQPEKPAIPYVEIPTSFRNHVMLRNEFVVSDTENGHARLVRTAPGLVKAVFLDPNLAASMSAKYAAATMMDTLLACIEGYVSSRSTFLSDTLFLRAIDTLKESIDELSRDPTETASRVRAGEAGLLCAIGLSVSSQGPGGALTYAINSLHNVPKSWVAAALLPHMLDHFAGVRPAKIAKVARALGEDVPGLHEGEDAELASTVARRIIAKLELPGRLRDFDLSLDDVAEIAEVAASFEMISFGPVSLSESDLYELVKQAF